MIFIIKGFKNLMVNEENLKVVSVDKGNGTFLCTDGAEYPLGDTTVTVEELQEGLVNDMMMLLASFSGRLYSARATENNKRKKDKTE